MILLKLRHAIGILLLGVVAVYAAGSAWVYRVFRETGPDSEPSGMVIPLEESPAAAVTFSDDNPWSRPGLDQLAEEVESFRLAGTYQTYRVNAETSEPEPESSLALVDDLKNGKQHMVREGVELGSFTVSEIRLNEIDLTQAEQTWTLTLPGRLSASSSGTVGEEGEARTTRFSDLPALETTPFGKRIAENQWVIRRQAIKEYAGEIINSPLRATQLYRSFGQVEDEPNQEEAGFRVQMKGEESFFGHMGITDDDIIRKVNSMKMKNQSRAEYLVGEFMKDRMGMVVLDIERNGENRKLIYLIEDSE